MGTDQRRAVRRPERPRRGVTNGRRFKALVRRAVASLPQALRDRMDNVDIIVRGRPTPAELHSMGIRRGGTLLGLYQGTPLPFRNSAYNLTLPDRIYLFRQPLEQLCSTDDELVEQIRRTVLHELAHHFGIDDARLHEIGRY